MHYTYSSVYENHRLFRKPPLLGPPLSCANMQIILIAYNYWGSPQRPPDGRVRVAIRIARDVHIYIYIYIYITYIYIYIYIYFFFDGLYTYGPIRIARIPAEDKGARRRANRNARRFELGPRDPHRLARARARELASHN